MVHVNVGPMPVNLISFTAKQYFAGVLLEWTAEAEQNFDRYELKRSFDVRNFSKTGIDKNFKSIFEGFILFWL